MIQPFIKKPTKFRAVQLLPNHSSILEVERFITDKEDIGQNAENGERFADYCANMITKGKGRYLKTPESDRQTQLAGFGDWIVEAFSDKLGRHFYPVKPDYAKEHYELVTE